MLASGAFHQVPFGITMTITSALSAGSHAQNGVVIDNQFHVDPLPVRVFCLRR